MTEDENERNYIDLFLDEDTPWTKARREALAEKYKGAGEELKKEEEQSKAGDEQARLAAMSPQDRYAESILGPARKQREQQASTRKEDELLMGLRVMRDLWNKYAAGKIDSASTQAQLNQVMTGKSFPVNVMSGLSRLREINPKRAAEAEQELNDLTVKFFGSTRGGVVLPLAQNPNAREAAKPVAKKPLTGPWKKFEETHVDPYKALSELKPLLSSAMQAALDAQDMGDPKPPHGDPTDPLASRDLKIALDKVIGSLPAGNALARQLDNVAAGLKGAKTWRGSVLGLKYLDRMVTKFTETGEIPAGVPDEFTADYNPFGKEHKPMYPEPLQNIRFKVAPDFVGSKKAVPDESDLKRELKRVTGKDIGGSQTLYDVKKVNVPDEFLDPDYWTGSKDVAEQKKIYDLSPMELQNIRNPIWNPSPTQRQVEDPRKWIEQHGLPPEEYEPPKGSWAEHIVKREKQGMEEAGAMQKSMTEPARMFNLEKKKAPASMFDEVEGFGGASK
jgi:hypothetical protein